VPNYYSQHGEDVLLDRIFEGQPSGFFVEVGCIDGVRFSNTLTFEQRGWKGLCIEAHADYIEQLRRNRPGSIIEHCAAGEADEESVPFYANFRGSLSSLDKSQEERFKGFGKYFGGFVEQKVTKRRLDTLFAKHGVERVDLLSLDIEGYEVEAIRGLDLRRIRPRVMVIEVDGQAQENALDALILSRGYTKSVHLGPNIFYLAEASLATSIRDRVFRAEVIDSPNALDGGAPVHRPVRIDTRPWRRGWLKRFLGGH